MVILPWPSRRVTGSMVIVWGMISSLDQARFLCSEAGECRDMERPAGYERNERGMKCVGRGWASGKEHVHLDELVDGPDDLEKFGHDDAGNLRLRADVLNVGAMQDCVRPDGIAHGWDVARNRAVTHGYQHLGVGADLAGLFLVID